MTHSPLIFLERTQSYLLTSVSFKIHKTDVIEGTYLNYLHVFEVIKFK